MNVIAGCTTHYIINKLKKKNNMIRHSALMLLFAAMSCQAIVVHLGADSDNLVAPADDPGWGRVGRVGTNGSGVYLGNGWVITANHVSKGNFTVDGDATYNTIADTGVQLRNTTDTAYVDLYMFRVDVQQGSLGLLDDVVLASSAPTADRQTVHIGTGVGQTSAEETGWDVVSGEWTVQSILRKADYTGYYWSSTRETRWAYESGAGEYDYGGMEAFATKFVSADNYGITSNNDSGSGLFVKNGEQWELAGVATAVTAYSGQPASTSVYGNLGIYADLSAYSDQITTIMVVPEPCTLLLTAAGALFLRKRKRL
jgi:hypothetical protein